MKKSSFIFHHKLWKNTLELLLASLIGFILPFWVANITPKQPDFANNSFLKPVFAQSLTPEIVAKQVYEKMPDFPKENQYLRQDSKAVDLDNTLISRIVRYHQYVKARPTAFRLDWKLTLADYLNANEIILPNRYPGFSTLTENPLILDQKAIDNLTISQRDQLVAILVSIYNPSIEKNSNSTPTPTIKPTTPSPPPLPSPKGAELLLP